MWENTREENTLQKKSLLIAIVLGILIMALAMVGTLGYLQYQESHLFLEGEVYPMDAQSLDLRGQDISITHYNTLRWQLPTCQILWDVPFQGGKVASNATELSVTSLAQEDLDIIYQYLPHVTKLDASGCDAYDLLEQFQRERPQCLVIYQVELGGSSVDSKATELTLLPQDFQLETLRQNLPHLAQVGAITFQSAELLPQELEALKTEFSEITIQATVNILGMECDSNTDKLDLSGMTSQDVDAVSRQLALLPNLTYVELMNGGSSKLEMADVKILKDSTPGVTFNYAFDFYGQSINTADKEVIVRGIQIGDEGEANVRAALDLMDGCERFVLDSCGISNELMAKLRDDYRGKTKVVWRVNVAKGSILTDVDCLYLTWHLTDENCKNLVYFEDVRYLDAGHNENGKWTDVSFVSGMPNLEVIIISGSSVSDLTGFENCKKLRVFEAGYCGYIKDITPLAGCESLEMLNISFTSVKDLSPLDELDVTLLCALNGSSKRVSANEQQRFKTQHPDCETHYVGKQPYGQFWRYQADNAQKFRAWYEQMATALDYEHYENNFDSGWYLDENGQRDRTRTA